MKKAINYLNNESLLRQIKESKTKGEPTRELCNSFFILVDRISEKGSWANYTWVEEMKGEALYHLVRGWKKFDDEKYNNPFAYYTQIVNNAFLQVINREKKYLDIKDELKIKSGIDPSINYEGKDNL